MPPAVAGKSSKVALALGGIALAGLTGLLLWQLRRPAEAPTGPATAAYRPKVLLHPRKVPPDAGAGGAPEVKPMFSGAVKYRDPTPAERAVGITNRIPEAAPPPIKPATKNAVEARFFHLVGECFRGVPPQVMDSAMIRLHVEARGGKVKMSSPPEMFGTLLAHPSSIRCARDKVNGFEIPMGPEDAEGSHDFLLTTIFVPPGAPPSKP